MSKSGKPITESDSLSDHLRDSLTTEVNKPDFRELDLGSPVSPLRSQPRGLTTTTTTTTTTSSSSSSSSGSVTGRIRHAPVIGRSDSIRSQSGSSGNLRTSQSRSDSGTSQPLVSSSQSSATSPATSAANVLPTGNICPSGKIQITGMTQSRSRSDVLGSGTGTYGHGSIMRGGGSSISPAKPISTGGGGGGSPRHVSNSPVIVGGSSRSSPVAAETLWKKAILGSDSEEVKRVGNEMYRKGLFNEALKLYDRAIALSPTNAAYRSNRAAALTGLARIGEAVKECEEAVRSDPNYGRAHHRLALLLIRYVLVMQ